LRRAVEPGQQELLVPSHGSRDNGGIVGRLARIDRRQCRLAAREVQRMQPARRAQRQGIGERRPGPVADARDERAGVGRIELRGQRGADSLPIAMLPFRPARPKARALCPHR
jgi:hypothetical protein